MQKLARRGISDALGRYIYIEPSDSIQEGPRRLFYPEHIPLLLSSVCQSLDTHTHTYTDDTVPPVLNDTVQEILAQKQEVARLKAVADQHPFYKYNGVWTRELQNLVLSSLMLVLDNADADVVVYRSLRLSSARG